MQKEKGRRKRQQSRGLRPWPGFPFFLLPFSFLLCLAGCAGDGRKANNDPLFGGPAIRANGGTRTGAQPTSSGPLPPLAAPSPLTSNAALAAGQPKPLDPTHDLRIGSGPNAVPTGWQGNGGSGAVLRRPRQLPPPGSGKEPVA